MLCTVENDMINATAAAISSVSVTHCLCLLGTTVLHNEAATCLPSVRVGEAAKPSSLCSLQPQRSAWHYVRSDCEFN